MASETPEYFLPRNWDYPPNGPIKIGNVITSLKEPHRPIATLKPDDAILIKSPKTLAEIDTEKVRSGGVAIMTTFLSSLLGAGADLGIDSDKHSSRLFTFDRLDTTYLDTTDENSATSERTKYDAYIKSCVEAPLVRRFLERQRFRKHVYVITGVKTVTGARCSTTASRATDVIAGAQVDGTVISGGTVPIGGGPEVRLGRKTKLKISWEGSTEFVLAYKVSKVKVDHSGNMKKEEEYLKGAFMESRAESGEPIKLAIIEVQKPQPDAEFKSFMVAEGVRSVNFGVPEDEPDSDEGDDD